MHRIFLPIYHFFRKHPALMYALMLGTFALFLVFGLQLRFEEDIAKLLPRSSTESELAFSDIELKDKVFIQVTSADPAQPVDPSRLGEMAQAYCDSLQAADHAGHIAGVFCGIDPELALDALDYGLAHLPSFVDTAWYRVIAPALEPEAIQERMKLNYDLMMADETGLDTRLVTMDPLGFRDFLLPALMPEDSAVSGTFTLYEGHLFCPDKTVAIALVSPSFDAMDSGSSTRFVRTMNAVRDRVQAENPDIRILFHGNVLGSVSNASTIKRDLAWSVGMSLLVILIVIMLSFHSFRFVLHQFLPIVYGTAFALACMYWIKGYMSLMALGIGAVVLGVGISYCLHILIHYYYTGDTEQMLADESTPVFLGCLTTVGAFLGLLFTESDLLRDFGIFATFALIGSTLFSLIFLPHFLKKEQIVFKRTHGFPLVERINSLPWDRSPWVIVPLVVAIIVGILFSPGVKFDSDLRNIDYDMPSLVESEQLYNEKNADGAVHLYFASWADNLDDAAEYNKGLFRGLDSLKTTGLVKSHSAITPMVFVSGDDQQGRIDAWKAFWSPARVASLRKEIASSARANGLKPEFFEPFFALVTDNYEPGDLYESGVIPPGLLSNFMEYQEGSGRYLLFTDVAFDKADTDAVTDALVANPHVLVLEPFYYCRDMVQIVHDDFSTTLWISSLFVLIVLLVSFRNIWISLIAFLPMFVSWFVMQGYMALFGLEFNLINVVISTFIYGIGVDYSIFVMEGLLKEARTGQTRMLAWHKVAIVYSALVLAVVTFSLIFTVHPAIRSIGIITLIGMASTILITYSLQPFLFRLLCRSRFFRRGFRIQE